MSRSRQILKLPQQYHVLFILLIVLNENVPFSFGKRSYSYRDRMTAPKKSITRGRKGKGYTAVPTPTPTSTPTAKPTPSPLLNDNTGVVGAGFQVTTFNLPKFELLMQVKEPTRNRQRRQLSDNVTYESELTQKTIQHLKQTSNTNIGSTSVTLVKDTLTETSITNDDNVGDDDLTKQINVVFEGNCEIAGDVAPTQTKQISWILDSFNKDAENALYLSSLKNSADSTLASVVSVTASLVVSSVTNSGDGGTSGDTSVGGQSGETVHLTANNNNVGSIAGMIVGIFVISSAIGYMYGKHRKRKTSNLSPDYELSDENSSNDGGADDVIARWGGDSKSLSDIAIYSANNDGNGNDGISQSWNRRKTPMSKLAAGATQEEFAEAGMSIDLYGQPAGQNKKKKKKKGSPVINSKKGSELDTNLDPIVEVNSSVASSLLSSSTDDKVVKVNLEVPKLLPALSVSSCPSDENSLREDLRESIHSPSHHPPALALLTPEPTEDDLMTPPSDQPLSPSILQNYTRAATGNEDGKSPVRKLFFSSTEFPHDVDSDKSSDSGVKDLLACEEQNMEERIVISEEEAVMANLIAFVDDSDNSDEDHDEIMKARDKMNKTLGADVLDKENCPPPPEELTKTNSTILVLSAPNRT